MYISNNNFPSPQIYNPFVAGAPTVNRTSTIFQQPSIALPNLSAPLTFMQQLGQLVQQVQTLSQSVRDQVTQDRAMGKGYWQGATDFSQSVTQYVDTLFNMGAAQIVQGYGQPTTPYDQVGQAAQLFLMGNLKRETLNTVLQTVGLDPSKISVEGLAELAYDYLTGASGAAAEGVATAGAEALGTAGAESAGLSVGGKVLGGLGAAYSIYGIVKGWGKRNPALGAANGASVGSYIGTLITPGIGTVIGGLIGGVVGGALGFIKTGKHQDQIARDRVRDFLKENGIIDQNWSLTLADGTKYDIGLDGGHRYTNMDGTERRAYNTDPSNPLTPQAVGMVNPLAFILTGGDKKLANDFAGYFTNAILSNATTAEQAQANAKAIFKSSGLTIDQAQAALVALARQGAISADEYRVFAHDVSKYLG